MLGRNAAAMRLQRLSQQPGHLPALGHELLLGHVVGLEHADVQVAVADVAEPDHLEVRIGLPQQRLGLGQEGRHRRNPHRDVVLVRLVLDRSLGDALAQAPDLRGLGLAAGDHAVGDPALLHAVLERRHRRGCGALLVAGELGDHVIRVLLFHRRLRAVGEHVAQGHVGEELERLQPQPAAELGEHPHQHLERGQRQQHDAGRRRRIGQAHDRLHHDPQGALGADHELAQVVTAGVLDQAAVEFEHLAGAADHGHPGDPLAGVAVADHADAAGIGGDVAADGARAARGEIHRVHQPMPARSLVQRLQRHAGLHGQGAVDRVEIQHLVHPLQAQHQFAIGRHRAAGQAGAATGGHDRHALAVGPLHHRLHFGHRGRQGDGQRRRRPLRGPVAAVVGQIGRIGLQAQRGHRLLQVGEAGVGHRAGQHGWGQASVPAMLRCVQRMRKVDGDPGTRFQGQLSAGR